MSKVTVQLDWDTVHKIVIDQLQSVYLGFKKDLENHKNGKEFIAIFHNNPSKDIIEIIKHMQAIDLILKYYGVSDPEFLNPED